MSGIYGFASQKDISDPTITLNRMLEAIQIHGPAIEHQWTAKEGHAGLGAAHPARIGEPGHFAEDLSRGVFCVFDGTIYRDAGAPGGNLVEPNGAALLLKRYLESGTGCLNKINGSFNVAWWDEKARRLVLANDKLSHRLLFFGLRAGTLVFASMQARIMATGMISPEIDVEGFADLLSYEYILGERTLFQDVQVLPPASILTYEAGKVDIQRYWHLGHVEHYGRYDEQRLDQLEDVFKTAVKRSLRPDLTCAIDLTGGLDSRCILAAAANQQLSFVTHTGGQPDSTDVVLAKEVAAQVGAQHIFEFVGPNRASEWLVPMVLHQGGIIATLHSHPCQHFDFPLPFDAVVQGHGGPFAGGHWVSPANLGISDLSTIPKSLKHRMASKTARHLNLKQLWRPEFQRLGLGVPEKHLRTLLLRYDSADAPVAVLDYLALREHNRKYLNKAVMIVRACRETYFPYFDHQWVETLAAIPISERVTNRIQIDLIRRLCPTILDTPYAKNLIPLSASPRRIEITKFCRRIRQRLSRRFEFVGRGPVKVPNHYYSQWIRNEMRPALVELLYNPKAAFRAYLRWKTVKTLLDQHFSGKDDWQHLVAALTVFEIAHRLWVDPYSGHNL